MADIIHALLCVFSAARYMNIAPRLWGCTKKYLAQLHCSPPSRVDFAFSLFLLLTKTPRFHLFTFSPFHLFTFDENTTISPFHFFTFSHHQSPETMLSPLISTLRQAEIHELVLSKEEATHADRLRKSDRITIDVDLCRLSCG